MKTIEVNGKKLELSFSPYSLLVYKQQFGVEPLDVVVTPLYNLCSIIDDVLDTGNINGETLIQISNKISEAGHINLYGIIWAFAKTADDSIPNFGEWMKCIDEFPILDVLFEIAPDFIGSMITKKKVNLTTLQIILKSLVVK